MLRIFPARRDYAASFGGDIGSTDAVITPELLEPNMTMNCAATPICVVRRVSWPPSDPLPPEPRARLTPP